jgi:Lysozyme like domain
VQHYVIPFYTHAYFSKSEISAALRLAGFPVNTIDTMVAIAGAESSYSNAIQMGQPYATTGWGTWQITPGNSVPSVGVDLQLLPLEVNARAAFVKWARQGLEAWSTYNNGVYRRYFD